MFYSAFVVAALYYDLVPFLNKQGFKGQIVFGFVVIGFFLILGYIYDKYLNLWKQNMEIAIEKDPYSTYKMTVFERKMGRFTIVQLDFEIEYLQTTLRLYEKYDIDTDELKKQIKTYIVTKNTYERWVKTGLIS